MCGRVHVRARGRVAGRDREELDETSPRGQTRAAAGAAAVGVRAARARDVAARRPTRGSIATSAPSTSPWRWRRPTAPTPPRLLRDGVSPTNAPRRRCGRGTRRACRAAGRPRARPSSLAAAADDPAPAPVAARITRRWRGTSTSARASAIRGSSPTRTRSTASCARPSRCGGIRSRRCGSSRATPTRSRCCATRASRRTRSPAMRLPPAVREQLDVPVGRRVSRVAGDGVDAVPRPARAHAHPLDLHEGVHAAADREPSAADPADVRRACSTAPRCAARADRADERPGRPAAGDGHRRAARLPAGGLREDQEVVGRDGRGAGAEPDAEQQARRSWRARRCGDTSRASSSSLRTTPGDNLLVRPARAGSREC